MVFVNNFLFSGNGRSGPNEGSLNSTIARMLCECEVGTWVIATAMLSATHNGRRLQLWRMLEYKPMSFSWTESRVKGFMYHVIAC